MTKAQKIILTIAIAGYIPLITLITASYLIIDDSSYSTYTSSPRPPLEIVTIGVTASFIALFTPLYLIWGNKKKPTTN